MSNVLNEEKKQQVIGLGRLGWTLRRIEQATGVRRETAGAYLKAAGIAVRPSGGRGPRAAKPANAVITDYCGEIPIISDDEPQNHVASASTCEPYRDAIELGLSRGRNAMAIWQDLVSVGYDGGYQTRDPGSPWRSRPVCEFKRSGVHVLRHTFGAQLAQKASIWR